MEYEGGGDAGGNSFLLQISNLALSMMPKLVAVVIYLVIQLASITQEFR